MQYVIEVRGISSAEVAKAIAAKVDSDGAAFAAFIDIDVREANGPVHASPVWTNRRTRTCESCTGFGTQGANEDECVVCLGSGEVDDR